MSSTLGDRGAVLASRALGRLFHAHAENDARVPRHPLRPHTGRRWAFSHYNVVIPDLPEPHRYLACAALLGHSGAAVFDLDHVKTDTPRRTATLALGTAATAPNWFTSYSTRTDCDLRPDGSLMRFGEDLTIAGEFPEYHVTVSRPDLRLELTAHCTGQVTTFARSPFYQHLGFPARYDGTLTWLGHTQQIEGLLSLEHARAAAFTGVVDRPIPRWLKLPWNFFTYHVIKIRPNTLLMLVSAEAFGEHVLTAAYVKSVDGTSVRHLRNVRYEILDYRDDPQVAPDGATMRIPRVFRWTILDENGDVETILNATADTDLIYGLGRGWIGGYSYEGRYEGEPAAGSAYFEYVRVPGRGDHPEIDN